MSFPLILPGCQGFYAQGGGEARVPLCSTIGEGYSQMPIRRPGPPLKETGLSGCHWVHQNLLCLVLMLKVTLQARLGPGFLAVGLHSPRFQL